MGGGEGSTAREAIKHKSIEKVIMCDIDQVINQRSTLFFIHFHIYIYILNLLAAN